MLAGLRLVIVILAPIPLTMHSTVTGGICESRARTLQGEYPENPETADAEC